MKKQLMQYYGFVFGSLLFSIMAQILIGGWIGFFISLGVFVSLPLLIKCVMGKRLRDAGIFTGWNVPKLQKICLVCGNKSNGKVECPRCGSKQFKML